MRFLDPRSKSTSSVVGPAYNIGIWALILRYLSALLSGLRLCAGPNLPRNLAIVNCGDRVNLPGGKTSVRIRH